MGHLFVFIMWKFVLNLQKIISITQKLFGFIQNCDSWRKFLNYLVILFFLYIANFFDLFLENEIPLSESDIFYICWYVPHSKLCVTLHFELGKSSWCNCIWVCSPALYNAPHSWDTIRRRHLVCGVPRTVLSQPDSVCLQPGSLSPPVGAGEE